MIINQGYEEKQYNVPGLGLVTLKNLQNVNEDSVLGKALLKHFPSICLKENKTFKVEVPNNSKEVVKEKINDIAKEQKVELLVEEPVQVAEVEVGVVIEEPVAEKTVAEKPKRNPKSK